jgi:hypothetical protein
MADIDAILQCLTETQKDIIIKLHDGPKPAWALRDDHIGRKATADMQKMPKGLVEKDSMARYGTQCWWYRLTETGLAVCNRLKGQ